MYSKQCSIPIQNVELGHIKLYQNSLSEEYCIKYNDNRDIKINKKFKQISFSFSIFFFYHFFELFLQSFKIFYLSIQNKIRSIYYINKQKFILIKVLIKWNLYKTNILNKWSFVIFHPKILFPIKKSSNR